MAKLLEDVAKWQPLNEEFERVFKDLEQTLRDERDEIEKRKSKVGREGVEKMGKKRNNDAQFYEEIDPRNFKKKKPNSSKNAEKSENSNYFKDKRENNKKNKELYSDERGGKRHGHRHRHKRERPYHEDRYASTRSDRYYGQKSRRYGGNHLGKNRRRGRRKDRRRNSHHNSNRNLHVRKWDDYPDRSHSQRYVRKAIHPDQFDSVNENEFENYERTFRKLKTRFKDDISEGEFQALVKSMTDWQATRPECRFKLFFDFIWEFTSVEFPMRCVNVPGLKAEAVLIER